MRGRLAAGMICLASLVPVTGIADEALLAGEIARHGAALEVTIGLAARHLESGREISVNGDQRFPLASTYKVPMAAYAMHRVGAGSLALEQMVEVLPGDLVISSPITRLFPHPGIQLSLLNLMEATLIQSDNTATDVLLRTIGGGEAVTRWLHSRGIRDMRVDRSTADLIRDYMNMPRGDGSVSMAEQYQAADFDDLDAEDWAAFYEALIADPRDQGTPRAMVTLLAGIWQDAWLEAAHGGQLREIMGRCLTGSARLSAGLPAQQLPIAHKTGTIGGTANDVGVMLLPEGAGSVAIAVYVKGASTLNVEAAERAIAEVGRTVYDYFLLTTPPGAADE